MIVCTRDRLSFLRRCLASLEHQLPTPDGFEVVVVDNGSGDESRAFLAAWAAASPSRRHVVSEPSPGLSGARNVGVAEARGAIVLFLDDDAIAPQGWVAAHVRSYDGSEPVDGVGGPVVLTWPDGRPAWATQRLDHWWSALDLGDARRPFPPPHGPYGTNMSIRRSTLLEVGGFSPALGRRGRSLLSGEEAALWARVWAHDGHVLYEPAALVVHQIVPDRLSRRWVLRRGVAQGRTNARLLALDGRQDARSVVGSIRAEARFARKGGRELASLAMRGDVVSSDVLDELARRAGHASAAVEHIRLWIADVLNVGWR